MKQLWSAVALLGVMVLVLGWNGSRLNGLIAPQQEMLALASQAAQAGEWETARTLTHEAANAWKDQVNYLHLVQSHRDVDEIAILLEESVAHAENQNMATYCAINARIQGLMDGIRKMEKLTLQNLM